MVPYLRKELTAGNSPGDIPDPSRKSVLAQLAVIHDVFAACGIPYWLDSGSAVGAWRGATFLPWDNDGDVGIFAVDALQAAACVSMHYGTGKTVPYRDVTFVFRVGFMSATILFKTFHSTLPGSIDGILFSRRDQHVFVEDATNLPKHHTITEVKMPVSSVLPLKRCRFDHLVLWCPNDMEEYLHHWYGEDLSVPPHFRDLWKTHMRGVQKAAAVDSVQ